MTQNNYPEPRYSTTEALNTCLTIVQTIKSILRKYSQFQEQEPYSEINKFLLYIETELTKETKKFERELSKSGDNLRRDDKKLNSFWVQLQIAIKSMGYDKSHK
ncbi:hypothetical protein H6G76_05875 [Nostoc sp. FACHB-152]|uniref:hypothetical protein n=1 Tax=unclassified Nostoc TaxID=2593658 RepID=UPI0016869436|nr:MULTISPECIES: hypothetical protein [unclassified Nostoc]MBD2446702.1 hypothetical protein [Nostoc sp. FACHB-152]MBD2466550.1 hypothetical protein [Nostoc sp. FACHB-145]